MFDVRSCGLLAALALVLLPVLPACDSFLEDDDDYPDYDGVIDLDTAEADIVCNEDDQDYFLGEWDALLLFDGWASEAWVEMWSDTYCEGYDEATGNPCDADGQARPGWEMENWDYGWDEDMGHWDQWQIILPFDGETWPPAADTSYFTCDDAIEFYFCACDDATEECFCSGAYVH